MSSTPSPALFGRDHEVAQVHWARLDGSVALELGPHRLDVEAAGPTVATIPMPPHGGVLRVHHRGATVLQRVTTPLRPPPGAELVRFATINDLHFGSAGFDHDASMREVPEPAEAHWQRCTRAAIAEAHAWGATRLVIKGDLTHTGSRRAWDLLASTLADAPMPVTAIPGNHDTFPLVGRVDPYVVPAQLGIPLTRWVDVDDLPGIRIIRINTTLPHHGRGRLAHVTALVADAAADARRAGRAAFLAAHHHINPAPFPIFWPNGITKSEGEAFLRTVGRANRAVVYTAGHTHRHRRRTVAGVTHVEVGSPKDYPGTWAGYVVHEGGIIQTVRRVARPDCVAWTERTAGAAHGLWGRWSPGRLEDRCFALTW